MQSPMFPMGFRGGLPRWNFCLVPWALQSLGFTALQSPGCHAAHDPSVTAPYWQCARHILRTLHILRRPKGKAPN